jgi:sec-independent protein translocase protein TatA
MGFGPLGLPEIGVIVIVALLIFGPRRLPRIAKGVGEAIRKFRSGMSDITGELDPEPAEKKEEKSDPVGQKEP